MTTERRMPTQKKQEDEKTTIIDECLTLFKFSKADKNKYMDFMGEEMKYDVIL